MMLHKAKCSFISSRQKTAKTECGKIVAAAKIATTVDADCPGCRAAAEESFRGAELVLEHCKKMKLPTDELESSIPGFRANMYKTAVFL